jgi:hypothetical protein
MTHRGVNVLGREDSNNRVEIVDLVRAGIPINAAVL